MTALTVFSGGYEPSDVPFVLNTVACRPGLSHEAVALELPPTATAIVSELAALDGLPVGLWAALAVESERARAAAHAEPWVLDAAAHCVAPPAPYPTRLGAYAAALRAARGRPATREAIMMPVPYHSLLAWSRAADARDESLLTWICARLEVAPRRRHLWEAAAAEHGQMLAEWVALVTRPVAGSTPPPA